MNELFGLPKLIQPNSDDILKKALDFLNRNAREPKKVFFFLSKPSQLNKIKANHGARPCSSVMRRLRKRAYYRRTRENIINDPTAEKLE